MHDDPDCIDIPAMPRRNHSLPKHAAKLQNASLSNFMDYYNDGPLRLHSVSSSIIWFIFHEERPIVCALR